MALLPASLFGKDVSAPSSEVIKFWLMTSVAVNVLFLSALLCRVPPRYPSHQINADGGRNMESHVYNAFIGAMASSDQLCSGQGHYEQHEGVNGGSCRCYSCFTGSNCSEVVTDCVINFDHGDPKMFEAYWLSNQDATTTVLLGGQKMSYFANTNDICWFLEPSLAAEIKLVHELVGNAISDGHHIIVGTGSSQLIHAALYALSSTSQKKPVDIVSEVPFYSSYPPMADFLESGLHRWAGDSLSYEGNGDNSYIELVTSPSNPDGMLRNGVVNGTGAVIYDLAYYWPHFTPIVSAVDYDIMLFTVSKSTGHAGMRIGWALVRDPDVAKRMTKYIELNTIGVSKDSQLRASQIFKSIRNAYTKNHEGLSGELTDAFNGGLNQKLGSRKDVFYQSHLFHYGYKQMESRWRKLRAVVDGSACFRIENFPPAPCTFFGKKMFPHPAFAWLRCEMDDDCHAVFKANRILTRSGIHFGSSSKYVRISMVDRDNVFELFVKRLQSMTDCTSG